MLQTSPAEVLPGPAEEAGPPNVGLHEEHHSQPAETSTASHKSTPCHQNVSDGLSVAFGNSADAGAFGCPAHMVLSFLSASMVEAAGAG